VCLGCWWTFMCPGATVCRVIILFTVECRVLGKLSPFVLVICTLLLIMCLCDPCCSFADHVSLWSMLLCCWSCVSVIHAVLLLIMCLCDPCCSVADHVSVSPCCSITRLVVLHVSRWWGATKLVLQRYNKPIGRAVNCVLCKFLFNRFQTTLIRYWTEFYLSQFNL
jgi:hypothetical protein